MICVTAFCSKDVSLAKDLLEWIKLLGACKNHDALLVSDASVQWYEALHCLNLAREIFKNAELISTDKPLSGWPSSANAMFTVASQHLVGQGQPFFWLEPDCIPLRVGWLDEIEQEYKHSGKLYLGAFVRSNKAGLPGISLGGCAVYPPDAVNRLKSFCTGNKAWDVASAASVIPQAYDSKLIHWFWGQPNLAPTFVNIKTRYSPVNAFTLIHIRPEAAIFHRNKDGSLIRLLKQKYFPGQVKNDPILVVLPFCNRDAVLMHKSLNWMIELGGCRDHDCMLSIDSDTLSRYKSDVQSVAAACFHSMLTHEYRCGSVKSWPQGANIAFRSIAHRMLSEQQHRSWLWLEPDAIPLVSGWLDRLQIEYEGCGKLFMGSVVPGMGHVNGTAIYPWDAANIIPRALSPSLPAHIAWDSAMKPEMIHLCHDAGHLMQHCWGIVSGQPHPCLGESPIFDAAWKYTAWVNPNAVLFHRNKDGSLIDCIRSFNQNHR